LREIDLSYNPLGAAGLAHIAEAVTRNETVVTLNLSACEIEREAMMAFQKALQDNHTLTTLYISKNPVKPIFEEVTMVRRLVVSLFVCIVLLLYPVFL
jgi:hypothetical protein